MADTKAKSGSFKFTIPLDASEIEGFKPDQKVKVLIQSSKGTASQTVAFGKDGHATANLALAAKPASMRAVVGPANASDDELLGLQTLSATYSRAQLAGSELTPIRIPPYYWWWWLGWCREFVIRGRVVCPDGSPVPGATVCAYDVDWWFLFWSKQLVGCATTDINGTFEIDFRWCCGWWPWWWWRNRIWEYSPVLAEKVQAVLKRHPEVHLSGSASNQPSLSMFNDILAPQGVATNGVLRPDDVGRLEGIRQSLLAKLPAANELNEFRIWPWWPWYPWWDCTPDIIFRVTQDCIDRGTVIVDEGVGNTRWDIPDPLNVTLVANEKACCRQIQHDCHDEECIVIAQICGDPITDVGGNDGAPAIPAGYWGPGNVAPGVLSADGDRPYTGVIPVIKETCDFTGVDYYEIQVYDTATKTFVSLPAGGAVNFVRLWMDTSPCCSTGTVPFNFVNISGHNVVESKEHFEATGGLTGWGSTRFWLVNEYLLVPLNTSAFGDGTFTFQVTGWQLSGGVLVNPQVLPLCGTGGKTPEVFVLTFDNQGSDPITHPPSHNCGLGVHICTQEPDNFISSVKINGVEVGPCGNAGAAIGMAEIDFLVTDDHGDLGFYTLYSTWGLSLSRNLLDPQYGGVVTPIVAGTPTGWSAAPNPNPSNAGYYGVALSQGASAPFWYGGQYRLTIPAANAFPEPCCYQLQLYAYRRVIVGYESGIVFNCDHGYDEYNLTERTAGVGVCPQIQIE